MIKSKFMKRTVLGTALAAVLVSGLSVAPISAQAQPAAVKPANEVALSVGAGKMVRLDGPMTDLFVANDTIADVQVRSADQIYIFGKAAGETTVFATNKSGKVMYSATVRVGNNMGSVDEMLRLAMPDAQIRATPMNGAVLLTGTVAAPADVEEAGRIVQAYLGTGTQVISRLKTATPQQVMLQVRVAEVSRTLTKDVGLNLLTRHRSSGFLFGLFQGRSPGTITDVTSPTITNPVTGLPAIVGTEVEFTPGPGTTIGGFGNIFGVDVLAALDLAQEDGRVKTLAEPTLTALSGETASFLAGGEFPIATTSGLNGTSVEFKEYGVSLAFTPTVLEGGRISMRVRPEVSELSDAGAVTLNGVRIPALSTRRAETTVELGSGQSFMIGGLLQNASGTTVNKAPWLGDLPILGALFRSNKFRRNESELVIVITPYLVKPVNANQIALPTDGYRVPDDAQRVLLDQDHRGRKSEGRPGPVRSGPRAVGPGVGPIGSAAAPQSDAQPQAASRRKAASAAPGFSF